MSSAVVLAARPYVPPRPPLQPGWEKTEVTIETLDGRSWIVSDPASGVFIVRNGLKGLLGDTKIEHKRDRSPAVAGALWRGVQYHEREGSLDLYMYHDGSTKEYVEASDAFWAMLDPEQLLILRVRIPGVRERVLHFRYGGDGSPSVDLDPAFFGWQKHSIDISVDQPFWRAAEPVTLDWSATEDGDYFADDPDVYFVGENRTLETAFTLNEGDRPAAPVWTFEGPMTAGSSVTILGHTIEVPFSIDDGDWVRADADPVALSVVDNTGADRFTDMGELDWALIPPHEVVPIDIVLGGGTGRVTLTYTPLYRRAL